MALLPPTAELAGVSLNGRHGDERERDGGTASGPGSGRGGEHEASGTGGGGGGEGGEREVDSSDEPEANLIVNYLPNSFDESSLLQLFQPYGPLESVKVVKERGTLKSMGYGFVKFRSAADAQRAVVGLTGYKVENKALKVAVARPQGSAMRHTNLFVAGLEQHMNADDLRALFQPYGPVTEAKVLYDPSTRLSRCVGFVRFDTQEGADAAVAALHGVSLTGASKPLVVRVAEDQRERRAAMQTHPALMAARAGAVRYGPVGLYGGGGGVPSYHHPFAPSPCAPHPAPYVASYAHPPSVYAAAPPTPPPALFDAPGSHVAPGRLTRDLSHTVCLFVYNLPPQTDENYMFQLFSQFGPVVNVKVMRDLATALCKGYGFVNMAKLEDADLAIAALNGAQIGSKTLQVSFKQSKGA